MRRSTPIGLNNEQEYYQNSIMPMYNIQITRDAFVFSPHSIPSKTLWFHKPYKLYPPGLREVACLVQTPAKITSLFLSSSFFSGKIDMTLSLKTFSKFFAYTLPKYVFDICLYACMYVCISKQGQSRLHRFQLRVCSSMLRTFYHSVVANNICLSGYVLGQQSEVRLHQHTQ